MSMLGLGLSLVKQTAARVFGFVRDGLKAYYRFYETTPDFLLEGSTSFDGSDDNIDIGNDSSLNFGTGDLSLSAWVKSTSTAGVIYSSYDGSAPHIHFRTYDSLIRFYMNSGSGDEQWASTTEAVVDGKWHHIAVSVDRDVGVSMYIDGSLETLSVTGTIGSVGDLGSSEDFKIGSHASDATYWNGSIANVGIWNRALSASEVESIYWRGSYSELQDTELTNLVSWWDLQGDVNDKHGSNNGTNNGATLNSNSYSGTSPFKPRIKDIAQPKMSVQLADGSTSFDGSNDYIDCGDDTSLDITSAITISCWIKPSVIDQTGYIVARDDGTNRNFLLFLYTDEKIYFDIVQSGSGVGVVSGTTVVAGTWYHITATYDGSNQKLYINGSLEDDDAETGAIDNDDVSLEIGRKGDSSNYFNGSIANVGVWSRALTQTQIQEVMFAEKYAGLKKDLGTEMVTGGDCSTDSFTKGTGWTYDSANEQYDASLSGETYLEQNIGIVVGKLFEITYTISNYSAGTVKANTGGYQDGTARSANGTYTETISSAHASTTAIFYLIGSSSFVGSIDNISVREIEDGDGRTDLVSWYDLGEAEKALNFDGTNDFVATSADSTGGLATYSFWARSTNNARQVIFGHGSNVKGAFYPHFTSQKPLLYLHSGGYHQYWAAQTASYDGIWHHWVVVLNFSDIASSKLYIDGALIAVDSTATATSATAYTQGLTIGAYQSTSSGGSNLFIGNIKNFAVYDTELTSSQISTQYNLGILGDRSSDSDLVGYWEMDSASTVTDLSSNSNNGTVTNASLGGIVFDKTSSNNDGTVYGATTTTGYTSSPHGVVDPLNLGSVYSGTAVNFDNVDDYITIPASADWNAYGTDFTVSCWAIFDSFANYDTLIGSNSADFYGWSFQLLSTGRLFFLVGDGGSWDINTSGGSQPVLSTGQWYNIVIVKSGTTWNIYANGVLYDGPHTGNVADENDVAIWIGNSEVWNTRFIDGRMNNIKILKYAFTQAQIQELYANPEQILPTGVASSNLKLYLPMQEGVGSYAYDGSPNQNHATLIGATWVPANNQGYQNALVRSNVPMIFDGSDDYVATVANLWSANGNNSFSCWINIDSLANMMMFDTAGAGDFAVLSSGKIRVHPAASNFADTTSFTLSANQWYHIVLVQTSSTRTLYVDADAKGLTNGAGNAQTVAWNNPLGIVDIGHTGSNSRGYFDGLINEVAVWDVALDADAVTALYNSGTPLLPTSDSGNYDNSDDLQGYWRNDGVTTWTDRANTGVASFDGSGDYLQVSSNGTGTFNNQSFTISAWVKFDTVDADHTIFSYDFTSHANPYYACHLRLRNTEKLMLAWNDGSSDQNLTSTSTYSANTWYHIACTFTSGSQKIYVNNSLEVSSTRTDTITYYAQEVWIGKSNNGWEMDGLMANVSIFDVSLTESEVSELYAIDKRASISGHSKFSNCVGSWLMGAGSGDTKLLIQDQTSNNNDATVTNATLVGYRDGTASGTPADILLPEGTTAGRDTQGFLLSDTTSISNGIRLHGNEYIDCGDPTVFDIRNNITLEAWIKPAIIDQTGYIITRDDGTNRNWKLYLYTDEYIYFDIYLDGGNKKETKSTSTVAAGTWYHVVATYDGSNQKLYFNGAIQDTDAETGVIDNDDVSFAIGSQEDGANAFTGSIDEARVYNRALTATEVLTNYNNGKSAHP